MIDKDFWVSLAENDYKLPEEHSLGELTKTLFGYLGSTDPELRDDIAYIVYANFLKREMYTREEIRGQVDELLDNLGKGIGEDGSDSVFLRTFSVLLLAEIVHNDNKKPILDQDQVHTILRRGLWYLEAEKDPRGYIPVKGWAHALAHTADLLLVLGKNRFTSREDHEAILKAIAEKLNHSENWVYIHGEDERLTGAVMEIIKRETLSQDFLSAWLDSLVSPKKTWKGAYTDGGAARAFHNVRNFLRSVFIEMHTSDGLTDKDKIDSLVFKALSDLRPF